MTTSIPYSYSSLSGPGRHGFFASSTWVVALRGGLNVQRTRRTMRHVGESMASAFWMICYDGVLGPRVCVGLGRGVCILHRVGGWR